MKRTASKGYTYSADQLTTIETWLAAHYYGQADSNTGKKKPCWQ
jgi:hypothetical protein